MSDGVSHEEVAPEQLLSFDSGRSNVQDSRIGFRKDRGLVRAGHSIRHIDSVVIEKKRCSGEQANPWRWSIAMATRRAEFDVTLLSIMNAPITIHPIPPRPTSLSLARASFFFFHSLFFHSLLIPIFCLLSIYSLVWQDPDVVSVNYLQQLIIVKNNG